MQIYHNRKESEPIERAGDNSPRKEHGELETVSSFAYLVNVREAFGYTPEQTLESSFVLIEGMMQEYAYMLKKRNDKLDTGTDEEFGDYEWVDTIDFDTGKPTRVKRYNKI